MLGHGVGECSYMKIEIVMAGIFDSVSQSRVEGYASAKQHTQITHNCLTKCLDRSGDPFGQTLF